MGTTLLLLLWACCGFCIISASQGQVTGSRSRHSKMQQDFTNSPLPKNSKDNRKGKFSIFKIVRFDNSVCRSSTGFNGTCYTNKECLARGGVPAGSCALGYGSCCLITLGCGTTTSVNNTYFVGPSTLGTGTGNCQHTITKVNDKVCQLRLDFDQFQLASPDSTTGACMADKLVVTGSTDTIPAICGINNGQHMYIHCGQSRNPVTLTMSGTREFQERNWRIRITQVCCDNLSQAPEGCLQYFTGATGQIRSFNWQPDNKGIHLNNQFYSSCVRAEQGFCSICYMQCAEPGSFSIQKELLMRMNSLNGMVAANCIRDFVGIPCGQADTAPATNCNTNTFCGGTLNVVTAMANPGPVCSRVRPFHITFKTDADETMSETAGMADSQSAGFCLNYVQNPC